MTFCGILGSPPKCHRNYDFYKRNRMCFGVVWWGVVGGSSPAPPPPPVGWCGGGAGGDPRIRQKVIEMTIFVKEIACVLEVFVF